MDQKGEKMDKKRVSIYIATGVKGPHKKKSSYMYLLETRLSNGENYDKWQWMAMNEETTENKAAVYALEAALNRLTCSCSLTIWTECTYLAAALQNQWYIQWREHDWNNRKGQPIADVEKWRRIEYLLNAHDFQVRTEHHEFSDWMACEIKKKEEKADV